MVNKKHLKMDRTVDNYMIKIPKFQITFRFIIQGGYFKGLGRTDRRKKYLRYYVYYVHRIVLHSLSITIQFQADKN